MAYPRFVRSRTHARVHPTVAETSINTGSAWANLSTHKADFTDIDLAECQVGDVIATGLSGIWFSQAVVAKMDVAVVDGSGTIIELLSSGTTTPGLYGIESAYGTANVNTPWTISSSFVVEAGHLDGDVVHLRPRVWTAGARTFAHGTGTPWWAMNLGPAQG